MAVRRTHFRFCAVSLLVSCWLMPTAYAGDAKWVEVHSSHFVVATDAGDRRAREVALHFEQMRAIFGQLILKDKVNIPVPLQIVGFRNSKEVRQYTPVYKGKAVDLGGFFQPGEDRNYIVLDLSSDERWPAVFHEYAHMLLNGNYPETQLWFDEGFAEYYSTIDVTSKGVEIGKPPAGDMELLGDSKWMPIATLFGVEHDSRAYNERDASSLFYAESWVVVHYLMDMTKIAQAGTYFDLVLNQHVGIEQAIQRAFGMNSAQMLKAVQNYYRSPQAVYRRFKLPLDVETMNTYTAKALSALDARAMLGDLAVHTHDHLDLGIAVLETVLREQPKNAAAERGLGYAYLYKSQFAQAGQHFSRAADLESNDPWVQYYSALLRYRESGGSFGSGGELENSKRELRAAIRLNPQFADAYNLLGIAEMQGEELPHALRDLTTAVQLSPRNEMYLANLSEVYLMLRKWDEAKILLDKLQNSNDPKIAEAAKHNLQEMDTIKASSGVRVVESGKGYDYTAPEWRPKSKAEPEPAQQSGTHTPASAAEGPVLFLKGTLKQVECSTSGAATLTIVSGTRTWKMTADDYKHAVVIGADDFSCDWHNKRVAINYRSSGTTEGRLVSLELQ